MMFNTRLKTAVGLSAALLTLAAATLAAEVEYGTTLPPGAKSGDLNLAPCEVHLEGDDRHYPGDCGTLTNGCLSSDQPQQSHHG